MTCIDGHFLQVGPYTLVEFRSSFPLAAAACRGCRAQLAVSFRSVLDMLRFSIHKLRVMWVSVLSLFSLRMSNVSKRWKANILRFCARGRGGGNI